MAAAASAASAAPTRGGSSSAASTGAASPEPERAEYRFEVQAPRELDKLLTTYLDLARFQSAPATEGITDAELERLMRAAPAQARGLLETEGYFNADVTVQRSDETGVPLLRMSVDPGPRTSVKQVSVDVSGALDVAVQALDPAAQDTLEALREAWPLPAGAPFRQDAWSSAKNTTIARLRADGYASANWLTTRADIDAPTNSARLSVLADSGPLFRLGAIRVEGLERYDAEAVRRLSNFTPGTPYSEKLLLDFQERIQRIGLFEGALVVLDADPASASAAPVRVRVKELPLQQATFGVGYSANTGPRTSLEHYHRRAFGSRWIAHNKIELGPALKSWEGELTSYPLEGLYRNLISGAASELRTDDQTLFSSSVRVGRTQDTPSIERLYFAELAQARLRGGTLSSSADAASFNYHWVFRDLDNVLLPTDGITMAPQLALGYGRGHQTVQGAREDARGPFVRTYGRLTWYRPLGGDWFSTVRVEAGQVFTKNVIGVPETLLFRAGGDDSVRGYGYRTLGPRVNGVVTGGRTLLTGSAEIARPISPKYPSLWWAAFVDAGNAAERWSELRPAFGYGVGLRWRSPVGPLRVDLAYGQDVRQFRVHLSMGIAF
ncbi:MAG: BamA/TamA family outer membrane protein [Burkholderiaceae bacterium]